MSTSKTPVAPTSKNAVLSTSEPPADVIILEAAFILPVTKKGAVDRFFFIIIVLLIPALDVGYL